MASSVVSLIANLSRESLLGACLVALSTLLLVIRGFLRRGWHAGKAKTSNQVVAEFGGAGSLKGRVAVITGGNGGIGLETARALASAGCRVLVGSRSVANGLASVKEAGIDEALVEVWQLDLEDLGGSVAAFAAKCVREARLDYVVLNSGIMALPTLEHTKHGFEKQLGTNHYGHFHLVSLLVDKMKAQAFPSRVVALSSIGHNYGRVDPKDLNYKKGRTYRPWTAYGQSKGANILFIRELADQLKGSKVCCLSLHPGVIASTGLGRNMGFGAWAMDVYGAITGDAKTIPQGAATTLTACLDPALVAHSGSYLSDCRITETSPHCQDSSGELRKALWRATASDISEALKR